MFCQAHRVNSFFPFFLPPLYKLLFTHLVQIKHFAPSASVQESEGKASGTLFAIFRSTLAEYGIKLSDLAGGTTGSGPEVEAMCATLQALHGIGWDRCGCRLADKAAEHAFVSPSPSSPSPRKAKSKRANEDASDVIKLVVETARKAYSNQSGAFKQQQKLGEDELEMLNEALEIAEDAAPQRWLCLVRVMERIIRSWHALAGAYADDGERFPLDEDGNRDDFLQLYSLLQPLSAITRDGGDGFDGVPKTAEMHLLFAKLKAMVLNPEEPLRVFDVPPPATTGFSSSKEAQATNAAAAPTGQKGSDTSQGLHPGRSRPTPLPFTVVPSGQLRPAIVRAREELSRALVHGFYSRIWDGGAADPSPYRDAAVLLTPPFVSGKYLEALRLTAADARFLPAPSDKDAGVAAPTADEEVAGKLDSAWADIRARASEAAREDQRRSASRDGGGAGQQQPLRKRPRVEGSSASGGAAAGGAAATPGGGYASFGWGGEPSVFAAFGQGETGDSTDDEGEGEGEGLDSDEKWMDAAVAEEIERYQAMLVKPKEVCLCWGK